MFTCFSPTSPGRIKVTSCGPILAPSSPGSTANPLIPNKVRQLCLFLWMQSETCRVLPPTGWSKRIGSRFQSDGSSCRTYPDDQTLRCSDELQHVVRFLFLFIFFNHSCCLCSSRYNFKSAVLAARHFDVQILYSSSRSVPPEHG